MPTYTAGEKSESKTAKKAGKTEIDHIRIMKSENGGHIVEHHFGGMFHMEHEPKKHVFGEDEGGKLLDHVAHHMGITDTEDEGESEN